MDFMKYDIPFKTIQNYFQLSEHIFCGPSSSSILLLTYNLHIPFPISVHAECPWVKSWDQINFFHYKSVLSSFRSAPVLAKKQLFSSSNEYPTHSAYIKFSLYLNLFYIHVIYEFLQPVQESAYPFRLFYLLRTFSSSISLPPPAPSSNPS